MNPTLALKRLRDGNARFAAGLTTRDPVAEAARRGDLTEGQAPIATILACSDSRVPPKIVFDQWLGDLFVVRVAGHVVGPDQIGSIEFAAGNVGCRLIVVMGHTSCGAVDATLALVESEAPQSSSADPDLTPALRGIASRVRPAVEAAIEASHAAGDEATGHRDEILADAIRRNVILSIQALTAESELLERLHREEGLLIVGAEYSLTTGQVDFFHVPEATSGSN